MPTRDEPSIPPPRDRAPASSPERTADATARPYDHTTRAGEGPRAGAAYEPAQVGQIGRFIVLRRLGAGGMGVVYLTYDNVLDRKVAVKVLRGLSPADPERTRRLQREARAMARVSHPNVLQIYEVGEGDGALFLAMEYIHGESLRGWLDRRAPTAEWRGIVAMFVQAGRGLAAAHQAGLVHRDFKPDNVLVDEDGVARVADFGLARSLEDAPDASVARLALERSLDATLTDSRAVMGTPAYMSPEQHAGAPTDARTDQFSFCVALWEALHGERPFRGESLPALARAIARGAPAEPPAGSRAPAWLHAALVRGLQADPERRWPSMAALLEVLTDDPVARRRRRRALATGAAIVVAAIGGLALATMEGQSRAEVASRRAEIAAQQAQVAGEERDRALERAQQEAIRARDSLRMLALRSIKDDPTRAALVLQEVEDPASTVEWSQAARSTLATPLSAAVLRGHAHIVTGAGFLGERDEVVATVSVDRTARVWRADGTGDAQVLIHERPLDALVVAPDRRGFVAIGEATARLWALDSGPDAPVTQRGAFVGDPEVLTVAAAFSADGERLAVADAAGDVWLWEVASGRQLARLSGHGTEIFAASFDPAGARLLTGDGDGGLRVWRLDGGAHERPRALGGTIHAILFAADGRALTSARDGARLWSADLRASTPLRGHTGPLLAAAVDPAGREFATASQDGTARRWDAATGEELARLDHPGPVSGVVYSPDRRWLATLSEHHVRLWQRDNQHVVHALEGHAATVEGAAFSRDGARLLTHASDHSARVWRLDRLPDTMLFRAPERGVAEAYGGCDVGRVAALGDDGVLRVWACDGRPPAQELLLAPDPPSELEVDAALTRGFYADEEGVWALSFADLRRRRIGVHPRLGWRVALSPDGRYLASTGYDRTARVWDLEGEAPPVVLVGHTSPVVWDAAWSPDGATLATIGNDRSVRIWSLGPVLSDMNRGPVELTAAQVLTGHTRGAKTIAFDPRGAWVLTSSPDATARLWDPTGAAAPIVLAGHRGMIYDAAWSPDGSRVATASEDGTARIWRVDAPDRARVLRGHRGELGTVAWSPDGRAVVTAAADGTARVWSADDGVTTDVHVVGHPVLSARFTRDGAHVLLAVEDATVRLWRPARDPRSDPAALLAALRGATTSCLRARDRELLLLEDEPRSRAAHAACEARHGRTVDDNEGLMRGPAERGFRPP